MKVEQARHGEGVERATTWKKKEKNKTKGYRSQDFRTVSGDLYSRQ